MSNDIISLTPRQYQVGHLWAMGRNEREIAALLNISHRTVQSHVGAFCAEVGCRGHSGAFDWFAKNVWALDVPDADNPINQSIVVYESNKFVLYQGASILEDG